MVNRYILIKSYNPAYESWLRTHLKQKRILGDREYSWKEAQQIIMDMHARGVHDDFFQKYFWAWREHPEYAPNFFSLLRMVMPLETGGKLDIEAISRLDAQARERGQRILFTIEDAAQDFYEFYDEFLTKPLARDLERGADRKKLLRYFEYEEFTKIPKENVGQENVEKAIQEVARDLLERLRAISPEKILEDINSTLDQHYDKGLAVASPQQNYNYKSEYVQISTSRSDDMDKPEETSLQPARSYSVIKEGYEGIYYPTYFVFRALMAAQKPSNKQELDIP
jgi:hypothetical protein